MLTIAFLCALQCCGETKVFLPFLKWAWKTHRNHDPFTQNNPQQFHAGTFFSPHYRRSMYWLRRVLSTFTSFTCAQHVTKCSKRRKKPQNKEPQRPKQKIKIVSVQKNWKLLWPWVNDPSGSIPKYKSTDLRVSIPFLIFSAALCFERDYNGLFLPHHQWQLIRWHRETALSIVVL